jgi:hypothetical protein
MRLAGEQAASRHSPTNKRRQTVNKKKQFSFRPMHQARTVAILCASLLGGIGVHAQSIMRSFSADQLETTGKRTTTGKVYGNDKAFRVESQDNKGKHSITILRLDRKAVWVLMPDQKMYMDMGGIGIAASQLATSAEGAKVERESLGAEQVGAYHCDKYRVQTTYEGHVYKSFEWDAKELGGFPVKQQGEKGEWSKEYQNVHLGPQDASLFEIPEGYKKMDLGGMFGNR